jgi:hypothetical protein
MSQAFDAEDGGMKWTAPRVASSLFSLPFKGRAGVGMVLTPSTRQKNTIPTQTLPLKGMASKQRAA